MKFIPLYFFIALILSFMIIYMFNDEHYIIKNKIISCLNNECYKK